MAESRSQVRSDSQWEDAYGYSRAVRVGTTIFVSGTTAADPNGGSPVGGADIAAQARECFRRIERCLGELGAGLEHVTRTRMFVTDIQSSAQVGAVHAEFFKEIRPAATMVEVSSLIDPRLLVEIEVDAGLVD